MRFIGTGRAAAAKIGALGIAGVIGFGAMSVSAVHEDYEFPAAVHLGSCEEPGVAIADLGKLVRLPEDAREGDAAGAAGGQVVHGTAEGVALEDIAVEDLFAEEHVVAVFDEAGENIIACGPISAFTYEEGDGFAFGLRSVGDSPYVGAVIVDASDGVTMEIYLVNNTPAPAATPAA